DQVIELAGEGGDEVRASLSWTLAAHVENLVLTGGGAINGTGNELDNLLTGNGVVNVLDGGAGNDTLIGGAGNDTMRGGLGDDTYDVDSAGDVLVEFAGEGTDLVRSAVSWTLATNFENLTLTGTAATNATGNAAANILIGNAGANTLDGLGGADTMIGGAGDDTYRVDNASDVIVELAGLGLDRVRSGVSYTLSDHLENLTLTGTAAINGTGNALTNIISGNAADNVLDGGAGGDALYGLGGNDTLHGDHALDSLYGSVGNDIYVVTLAAVRLFENANEGTDLVSSQVSWTLATNFENLTLTGNAAINGTGNGVANVITGNDAANTLDGGAGNDTMVGAGGDDTYIVDTAGDVLVELDGGGVDLVRSGLSWTLGAFLENLTLTGAAAVNGTGNSLANLLTGNTAANVLSGGGGNDSLLGGAGNDTLAGDAGNDTLAGEAGIDTVAQAGNRSDWLVLRTGVDQYQMTRVSTGEVDQVGSAEFVQFADGAFSLTTGAVALGTTVATENQPLSVASTLANTGGITITGYQWQTSLNGVDWADIAGATSASFTPDDAQVGRQVRALVIYTDPLGVGQQAATGATSAVINVNDTPTGSVVIDDATPVVGQVLVASNTLGDADGIGVIALQWQSSVDGTTWVDLPGMTGSTLAVDSALSGLLLRVLARWTDAFGTAEAVASAATAAVSSSNGTIFGTGGDDILVGTSSGDRIEALGGNDTLDGGAGADTLLGGTGNDIYVTDDAGDQVIELASEGIDEVRASLNWTLSAHVENLVLTGGGAINGTGNELDNVLTGNGAANVLDGAAGNDTLSGGAGNDTMRGGLGDDTYDVDSAGDVLVEFAGEGADLVRSAVSWTLAANFENLTLTGSAAINATGNAAANVLTGNSGVNTLDGLGGADTMIGGAGDDTYKVDDVNDVIVELVGQGLDKVRSGVSYTLSDHLENLTLTGTAAINGTGNALGNVISGNEAANTLDGGAGSDAIYGAGGNDTLLGDHALDSLYGGNGHDTFVVAVSGVRLFENASEGTDLVSSLVSWTLATNFENLTLTGNAAINGTGNGVANVITGNDVANTIAGGAGDDTLSGGGGTDTLRGDAGADSLTGGTGADIFVFSAVADSGVGASLRDVIQDFLSGTDRIDLSGLDADTGTGGDQAFTVVGEGAAFTGAAQLSYRYEQIDGVEHTILEGNINADLAPDFQIAVRGHHVFSSPSPDLIP
ncbi:MAG: beta strand repeat-containing protein, partial [Aquabacterium sp.]